MNLNRTAKGIVLVPSLLLGGAFLSAAAWMDGPAAQNKGLALGLGILLLGAGGLAQLLPSGTPSRQNDGQKASDPPS
ncbi:MAG: GIVxVP protein [Cyanobacteriota bacterium]|nr:GIVxVP protein [Cyanobacteriota bacterium]